jgi:hypothetical protein
MLIPRSMRTELLHVVHVKYTAHLGYDKTAEQIQRSILAVLENGCQVILRVLQAM